MSVTVALLDDLPAAELRFRWNGGRECLDFVATVGERWRRSFERLRCAGDLGRWIAEAGLADRAPGVTAAQLGGARELREAIDRLARPSRAEEPGDRALVNAWAARPSLAPQLTADGGRAWAHDRPVEEVLAHLARDAIDLLSGPLAGRIRECGADDCALLFVDASRPGRRRWCSGDGCGNRARTRAYRHRRRESP